MPLAALVTMAVEHWRLSRWVAAQPQGKAGNARHALRRIDDVLKQFGVEAQDLDGRAFDPGLAVRVVDTVEDPSLPKGTALIAETVSPLVLLKGVVVQPADVVTRRGTGA